MGGASGRGLGFSIFLAMGRHACAAALFAPTLAAAADIYVSRAADGSMRYATQKLDESYSLWLQEATPAGVNPTSAAHPGKMPRTGAMDRLVSHIAQRHGVSTELVLAVVAVESGFDPKALSPKGARGAMQLTPATGRSYGLRERGDFEDPERNIDAGVRHLKDLLTRYDGSLPLALAAYNAGAGAVDRHGGRIPPYRETMLYVPAVLSRTRPAAP